MLQARQRVEAHVERDLILNAQFAKQQLRMRRRLIHWGLVIDALLLVAVLWYFFGH